MKNVNLLGKGFKILSLFLFIFIANVITMFAQNNDQCPLDDGFSYALESFHSGSAEEIDLSVSEPIVLNVFFWKVPDAQGDFGGQDFNQDKLLESIAFLNIYYNKVNDVVFNGNVTITPKDSTAINTPTLLNDLPNGLYSIEKQYPDGSSEQTAVQKGNN